MENEVHEVVRRLRNAQLPRYREIFEDLASFSLFCHPRMTGKSHNVVLGVLALAIERGVDACFSRLWEESLEDSLWREVQEKIDTLDLSPLFKVTKSKAVFLPTGVTFFFKGLANPQAFKGLKGVEILHIDEAQQISQSTMQLVVPSIRGKSPIILLTSNLPKEGCRHWLYQAFYVNPLESYRTYEVSQAENTAAFPTPAALVNWRREQEVFFRGRSDLYAREILGQWADSADHQLFRRVVKLTPSEEGQSPHFWLYHAKGGQALWLGVRLVGTRVEIVRESFQELPEGFRRTTSILLWAEHIVTIAMFKACRFRVKERPLASLEQIADAYSRREVAISWDCPFAHSEIEGSTFYQDPSENSQRLYSTLAQTSTGLVAEMMGLLVSF